MLRFLSDENFDRRIVSGLFRRHPAIDLLRVQDVGLQAQPDPLVLEWAAAENRVLLTHDRQTIPGFVNQRLSAGTPVPGVIVVDGRARRRRVIADILAYAEYGEDSDCRDQVHYLPWPE
jgi:predicted nuclease of predicted toxin-antitoxin system